MGRFLVEDFFRRRGGFFEQGAFDGCLMVEIFFAGRLGEFFRKRGRLSEFFLCVGGGGFFCGVAKKVSFVNYILTICSYNEIMRLVKRGVTS